MKLLVTIPHYYRASTDGQYGSTRVDRVSRVDALRRCIAAFYALFGGVQFSKDLMTSSARPANELTGNQFGIAVVTDGEHHVLDDLRFRPGAFIHCPIQVNPRHLGFACHGVLRACLGQYDYYCYLEDDLVLHDPWFFLKLQHFSQQHGDEVLLQPNRFEITRDGRAAKAYFDGELAPPCTAAYQDINDRAELSLSMAGQIVTCRRPSNPHSGCFFLNARQMDHWARQPYFLDCNQAFVGPLESAATLGVMRTFRLYKPALRNANFLEIEHHGTYWLDLHANQGRIAVPGLMEDAAAEIAAPHARGFSRGRTAASREAPVARGPHEASVAGPPRLPGAPLVPDPLSLFSPIPQAHTD